MSTSDKDNIGTDTVDRIPDFETNPKGSKKSFFSDEMGNLKFVNLICRYPTIIFFFMIFVCIASSMILGNLVSQEGNPITEDTNE